MLNARPGGRALILRLLFPFGLTPRLLGNLDRFHDSRSLATPSFFHGYELTSFGVAPNFELGFLFTHDQYPFISSHWEELARDLVLRLRLRHFQATVQRHCDLRAVRNRIKRELWILPPSSQFKETVSRGYCVSKRKNDALIG